MVQFLNYFSAQNECSIPSREDIENMNLSQLGKAFIDGKLQFDFRLKFRTERTENLVTKTLPNYPASRRETALKSTKYQKSVEDCIPWPSGPLPRSIRNSKKNILAGKIYASVSTVYNNKKDRRLLVQEGATRFGYYPHPFKVDGYVLFPPVKANEIWTVGYIQFENNKAMVSEVKYKGNNKFVNELV